MKVSHFHLAIFDGEVEDTPEARLQLAQYEAMRFPDSKKAQGKMWKAMAAVEDSEEQAQAHSHREKKFAKKQKKKEEEDPNLPPSGSPAHLQSFREEI